MAASKQVQATPSWLRNAAIAQFHNAGLAFKRCGSFVQAEAAYVKGMQLVETKDQLTTTVRDLTMVYDALVDAAGTIAQQNEYLRCYFALRCLSGQRWNYDFDLLLPEYVLMKDARKSLIASLPGLASDPPAVRRAILAATNPSMTIFERGEKKDDSGVSAGMQSGAAYATLLEGTYVDVGFCLGCHKVFNSRELHRCMCCADDATYCSKACQRAHWPSHKLTCPARKANKKAAAQAAPAPTEESLERARAELEAMKLRHDEREAAEAAALKAAEQEKRARVAAQRANRGTATPPLTSHPTNDKKRNGKDKENGAASAPTPAGRAKRAAAKEQSRDAQRAHEAALRDKEEQRVAQAERLAQMRMLGERIARGE